MLISIETVLETHQTQSLGPSSKLLRIVEWYFAGERMLAQFYMFTGN